MLVQVMLHASVMHAKLMCDVWHGVCNQHICTGCRESKCRPTSRCAPPEGLVFAKLHKSLSNSKHYHIYEDVHLPHPSKMFEIRVHMPKLHKSMLSPIAIL